MAHCFTAPAAIFHSYSTKQQFYCILIMRSPSIKPSKGPYLPWAMISSWIHIPQKYSRHYVMPDGLKSLSNGCHSTSSKEPAEWK
jgi:hypothetical protein